MKSSPRSSFIKTTKGKVIISLLLACLALFLAWGVSKVAFEEMLATVDNITAPSERLRMVNVISRKIGSLDQVQKNKAFNDPRNYRKLFDESAQLRVALDTLEKLYPADSIQLARIALIRKLLSERNKQFINYLKVRERLVNDKSFSDQVKELNSIVSNTTAQTDSTVLATVEKTSTTTIYPQEKPRSFLGKLFGRKRNDQKNSFRIVNEEKVKKDTIALSTEEQMAESLKRSLKIIERQQQQKNASFISREAELAEANSRLVSQMVDVLRKVETEVVNQIEANSAQAKRVVNTSISTMSIIMIVFVLLTGLLLYFILTDITRSARYRNELEAARDEAEYHGRAKQRFLSNMSHEIRTPLQSIIGYAEIIRKQDHPRKKDIDAIYHSSEHLLQIVNEVLDYNRIISGKLSFSSKAFNISELLEEVFSVMRPHAELKSLKMIKDFDIDGLDYVEGDPFRLKQILYNLLGNAIKFTPSGEVSLSVFYKQKGNDLHFTFIVKDTGVGISEEESKKVFNEFEQIDAPVSEGLNGIGTGLGLTIIKALIEQQGGRIYLKSRPGIGSAFTVYLTFGVSDKLGEDNLSSFTAGKIHNGSIWVVDDDPLILELCGIIFENNNIPYRLFSSPSELLAAKWDKAVKYVLMDMRMPEMTGIELCGVLRRKVDSEVKIFAITAQVLPDERENLLQSGFDGVVLKPFKETELIATLGGEAITESTSAPEEDLDLSSLKKMTYGDQAQLTKILLRFKEDCLTDSEAIRLAINENNLNDLRLITHRLAGRIAQLGAKELAGSFRTCELELRAIPGFTTKELQVLLLLMQRLENLIAKVDKELSYNNHSI